MQSTADTSTSALLQACRAVSQQSHAGSDPSKLVEELAKKRKKKVLGVSLGQGQDVIARKLMSVALAEGHWVLLQNAHLGLSYLAEVHVLFATRLA